jgi:hypothetical protein
MVDEGLFIFRVGKVGLLLDRQIKEASVGRDLALVNSRNEWLQSCSSDLTEV